MRAIFADTYSFIGLLNPSDAYHSAVVAASRTLVAPLVTTSCILIEVADALSQPSMRKRVVDLGGRIAGDPNVEMVVPDQVLLDHGLDLYARRPDKAWSLTDCISFVVMADRELTEALTGDHHFEQAGFRALLKAHP